ncbi:MAG TPA: 5'-nucleotidase C-terminal domain-containing protein [Gemmatimonadaceae bacterium]|jgi:5'-nucleotidase|nr:5'-nucleotidase C-terminal domain-containing protein [Gemmatimonadaceae bacterium]
MRDLATTLRTGLLALALGPLGVAGRHVSLQRPARPEARLRVIGTNDFHGALEPRRDTRGVLRGGAAALAATIERAEGECAAPDCQWVLVDGGDEFQGTLASNLAYGRPVSGIYNHLGYTAAALGNHEFDWGTDTLRARMRDEHYDVLAANVRFTDGRDVPWIRDDTIVTRGPFTIGIIGIITRSTETAAKASNIAGLRFDDPAPIVDSLTADLRRRGANTVIVLAHAGGFCDANGSGACNGEIFDMVRSLKQHVDAVVAGHSHSLVNTVINGVPIVQAYSHGSAIDVVDIPLDRSNATRHEVRNVFPDSIQADAAVAGDVSAAVSAVAERAGERVATIAEDMPGTDESPLGDLVADAMRAAGHADFAMMNHGGVRAALKKGLANYSHVFEVQPFGNVLYKLTAKGADMRRYFERSVSGRKPSAWLGGVHLMFDPARPAGSRITSLTLADGSPFDDAATYTIVINDFMLTGGSGLGFPGQPISSQSVDITDLDALIAYLRAAPQPVQPPRDVRIHALAANGATKSG